VSGSTLTITGAGTVVVAANQAGNTNYAAATQATQSVVVNKASQTITFTAPASPVTYGVAPIALSASASSGLTVTFSIVSGPGTVSGSTLTITGAGTVVVAANQTGNTNYAAATQVTQSVVVNKASQTITFTAPASPVTYGVAPIALSASASSGLAVTFSIVSGPGTVSGSTLTITGAGTVVVAANQAGNTNYAAATQVTQSVVVNKATPTITWAAPATIPPGTALSAVQLNATASLAGTIVSGAFVYTPAAGTVMTTGPQTLSVIFTPTDTADYNTAAASVTFAVSLVSNAGIITTVAGDGTQGYSGDSGLATSAELYYPNGVAIDSSGNIYIAEYGNNRVREVNALTRIITTVAGNGTQCPASNNTCGDGGPATSAELNTPNAVAVDSLGNIYIADKGTDRVRKVTASTGIITTVAGSGVVGQPGACPPFIDGVAALSASLCAPTGVALDSSGNIYIADQVDSRVRKVTVSTGIITTVAGSANYGYSGDGGPATSAKLFWPTGITLDSSGNIYIADQIEGAVRKVNSSTGIITTVAGNGTQGYSGDGGPATSAELSYPVSVAVDAYDNIYVGDQGNNRIRKVTASTGIISTVVGNGTPAFSGDGGLAINAEIDFPYGVVALPSGGLYFSDSGNSRIRAVASYLATLAITWATPAAITYGTALSSTQLDATSTVAGSFAYTPALGTVLPTGLQTLSVTFTPQDTTDYNIATATVTLIVNQVTPVITWNTPAAVPVGTALSSTQLNATASALGKFIYSPAVGTVLSSAGTATLTTTFTPDDTTDYSTATANVTLTVSKATPIITWAPPANISPGTALSATQLNATANVAGTFVYSPILGTVLPAGLQTLLVTFTPNDTADYNTVTAAVNLNVSILPSAGIINTVAMAEAGTSGVAVDGAGNIYYSVPANGEVLKMTPLGSIWLVAGTGTNGYSGDNGLATNAELNWPEGVAVDSAGNVYIADYGNCLVREVMAANSYIYTVAGIPPNGSGNGNCNLSNSNGTNIAATSAKLYYPQGVGVDTAGNLYIADTYRIRRVTAGIITTVAGNGSNLDNGDGGPATSAAVSVPFGVAVDSAGNIYIADGFGNRIRMVAASTANGYTAGYIYTVAGNGTAGYSGDGGAATSAELYDPDGVAVDARGNIYIADAGNNFIRLVTASTGNISTVAGGGPQWDGGTCGAQQIDSLGDGCPATSALLYGPWSVALDAADNLFIADSADDRIRAVGANATPALIVSTSGTPSTYGGSVTFTATFPNGGPTGTVTFYDGGTAIGTGTIQSVPDVVGSGSTAATFTTSALTGGAHTITASWPGNSTYNAVTSSAITQTVSPATPSIVFTAPLALPYGTALSSAQLGLWANVPGIFSCAPAFGTVLTVGSYTPTVTFAPTDTTDYTTATAMVPLTVFQATPVIVWPQLADIPYGTALSATQLDASSAVAGAFTYSPALGTVLPVGPHTLSATFTPADTLDYTAATATAYVTVTQDTSKFDTGTVTLTVNSSPVATVSYGATSTPSSIAEALAAAASSSLVTVKAVDDAVYLQATQGGAGTNYSYSLQAASNDPTDFPQPSFLNGGISGNLDGGAAAGPGASAPVYSYQVPSSGYDGVGNLLNYTDSVTGAWSNLGYDGVNRLVAGTQTPVSVNGAQPAVQFFCWSYDSFGNRTAQATSNQAFTNALGAPACQPAAGAAFNNAWAHYTVDGTLNTPDNGRNQLTASPAGSFSYDAAGDITSDAAHSYLYDADGRICAVSSPSVNGMTIMTGYLYDADGTRVAKGTITAWSCDPSISGLQTTNDYVLGPGGEQVTEVGVDANNSLAWQHTNVFAAGKLIATYDNDGLHFYLNDPLGTRRVQTDYAGVVEQTCSSLPYGDNLNCTNSTQYPTEQHFTGKERDTESGNDYFGARYYASSMGRFMSPDSPGDQKKEDPQSMNLYAYARNRPLTDKDPTGHFDCDGNSTFCGSVVMAAFLLKEASFDISNPGMFALQQASGSLGTYGDHNGVVITTADLGGAKGGFLVGAQTTFTGAGPKENGFTITFNTRGNLADVNSLARDLAHEGTHGVQDQVAHSMKRDTSFLGRLADGYYGVVQYSLPSFDGEIKNEESAYRTQGFMEQYLKMKGEIYDPTATQDQIENRIHSMALKSANVTCASKADGSPTCD
jgi:RHS repeat-associated protein